MRALTRACAIGVLVLLGGVNMLTPDVGGLIVPLALLLRGVVELELCQVHALVGELLLDRPGTHHDPRPAIRAEFGELGPEAY